ncbi:MAG: hypothetical protein ACKV2O_08525 [Acidimicrobiales bacterium]
MAQLPRLYVAASFCMYSGRPDDGVVYNETAVALEADPRYDPFPKGWSRFWEGVGHLFAGRTERALAIFVEQSMQPGPAGVWGRCGQGQTLAVLGRREEVAAIAEESLAAARAEANPVFVGSALLNHALAYELTDPVRALHMSRHGLEFAIEHRLAYWEANFAILAPRLEAIHGDLDQSLRLYDSTIASLHQAGNLVELPVTLISLASTFHRLQRAEIAAILHGAATQLRSPSRGSLQDRLQAELGPILFDKSVAAGAAMELSEVVHYARTQIQLVGRELANETRP